MKKIIALLGGMAGAGTVTLLHQTFKVISPSVAPRMDLLGMEAMQKIRKRVHLAPLPEDQLYNRTFYCDLIFNTLYYSLAGGNAADLKGTVLGIAAGVGAVELPEKLDLTPSHSNRTKTTQYLAIGMYIAGGLATAATIELLTSAVDSVTGVKVKVPKELKKAPKELKKKTKKLLKSA